MSSELKKLIKLFYENLLHLASAVIVFAAAIVPIYLSLRLKSNLRVLTVLLSLFIFIHGLYHLAYFAGEEVLGEGFFRTISIVVLIIFMINILGKRISVYKTLFTIKFD